MKRQVRIFLLSILIGYSFMVSSFDYGQAQVPQDSSRKAIRICDSTNKYGQGKSSDDVFIDVTDEPYELTPLEDLIEYPDDARRSGLEGKVTVQMIIGKDGNVEKIEIVKSSADIFKAPAINAIRREKFTPAFNNGKPLRIWITRTINFKLHKK